jgi:uncharacterized protein
MDDAHDSRARPRGQRSRVRVGDDGRRLATAGHGFVVAVLALLIGALLTAPGMHKSAFNRSPGTARDVALAVTGPLADLSHVLYLDRPRHAVQLALGRESLDEIDVAIEPIDTTPAAQPVRPATDVKQAFSPRDRLRIWIAGDSLILVPGFAIARAAAANPALEMVGTVDGRVSTGLERPDVFNWFREVPRQLRQLQPHAVVLGFGGNDDHDYMTGLREGTTIDGFGGPVWSREYGRRVGVLMDAVNRAGAKVIWVGLPITRDADQSRRFDVINAVVRKQALKRDGKAVYLDTYTTFASDDGGFAEYLQDGSGQSTRVRAGDGVHFEPAGGDLIAREVLRRLGDLYDFTSWRDAPTPEPG